MFVSLPRRVPSSFVAFTPFVKKLQGANPQDAGYPAAAHLPGLREPCEDAAQFTRTLAKETHA
jgi:hypothetical protein